MHFSKEKKMFMQKKNESTKILFHRTPKCGREGGIKQMRWSYIWIIGGRNGVVPCRCNDTERGREQIRTRVIEVQTFRDLELNCIARQSPSVCYQPAFRPSKNGLQFQK